MRQSKKKIPNIIKYYIKRNKVSSKDKKRLQYNQ